VTAPLGIDALFEFVDESGDTWLDLGIEASSRHSDACVSIVQDCSLDGCRNRSVEFSLGMYRSRREVPKRILSGDLPKLTISGVALRPRSRDKQEIATLCASGLKSAENGENESCCGDVFFISAYARAAEPRRSKVFRLRTRPESTPDYWLQLNCTADAGVPVFHGRSKVCLPRDVSGLRALGASPRVIVAVADGEEKPSDDVHVLERSSPSGQWRRTQIIRSKVKLEAAAVQDDRFVLREIPPRAPTGAGDVRLLAFVRRNGGKRFRKTQTIVVSMSIDSDKAFDDYVWTTRASAELIAVTGFGFYFSGAGDSRGNRQFVVLQWKPSTGRWAATSKFPTMGASVLSIGNNRLIADSELGSGNPVFEVDEHGRLKQLTEVDLPTLPQGIDDDSYYDYGVDFTYSSFAAEGDVFAFAFPYRVDIYLMRDSGGLDEVASFDVERRSEQVGYLSLHGDRLVAGTKSPSDLHRTYVLAHVFKRDAGGKWVPEERLKGGVDIDVSTGFLATNSELILAGTKYVDGKNRFTPIPTSTIYTYRF